MDNAADILLIEQFYEGEITFEQALNVRPKLSRAEVARLLGVPHPTNIIAYRPVMGWWRHEDTGAILEARAAYDGGVAEVCTGKYLGHFFLYCFPRVTPARHPRRYFGSYE